MDDVEQFRRGKDEFFRTHPQSPLSPEQQARFRGLAYFPLAPALVVEGFLEPAEDQGEVRMGTSTGGEQVYRRAGIVRFAVDGEPAQVTLFASERSHELFLPFRDATSGHESYPAGRYLEVPAPSGGSVRIDFNLAYNPFCAYSPAYECPLPPPENWLAVPVRAGEKAFPDASH